MRRLSLVVCTALLLPLAACQGAGCGGKAAEPWVTVAGDAYYLEKIVLPEGSMLHIQLIDLAQGDSHKAVVAEDKFPASIVPIPFRLEVDAAKLDPGKQYGVRAFVRSASEKLEFETEAPVPFNPRSPAPLDIRMDRPGGRER